MSLARCIHSLAIRAPLLCNFAISDEFFCSFMVFYRFLQKFGIFAQFIYFAFLCHFYSFADFVTVPTIALFLSLIRQFHLSFKNEGNQFFS